MFAYVHNYIKTHRFLSDMVPCLSLFCCWFFLPFYQKLNDGSLVCSPFLPVINVKIKACSGI